MVIPTVSLKFRICHHIQCNSTNLSFNQFMPKIPYLPPSILNFQHAQSINMLFRIVNVFYFY